jgi:hypothetical protein
VEDFYFWPMGVFPELLPLLCHVFLVMVCYVVAYLFKVELPACFVPPSQLVTAIHDCCCGLVSCLWSESVPDSPFVAVCFLFTVMVDSGFSLLHNLLL